MTATAHSLTGASLASLIPNPLISIPLAFFSNFLMDLIPHWDTGTGWRQRPKLFTFIFSGFDVILGIVLGLVIFGKTTDIFYLLLMMFTATLADWLEAPYLFLGWNFPPFSWFYRFQSRFHSKKGFPLGLLTQIVTVLPLVIFAYKK